MPPHNQPSDPDSSSPEPATKPVTDDNEPSTPPKKQRSLGDELKPASSPRATRPRGNSKKLEPPTLLADFLRGKPSPARLAAERQRRKSVDAVKLEIKQEENREVKQEMKQYAVRRLRPPSNVKHRVKAWQDANAGHWADPGDAATEPTDLAFNDSDVESVTEEDRVRIKMRQKKKAARPKTWCPQGNAPSGSHPAATANQCEMASPPKKRVVSDDNWVKAKPHNTTPRMASPKSRKIPQQTTLPSVSVFRQASQSPSHPVADRIKAWAEKVEAPAASPPRSSRSGNSPTKNVPSEGPSGAWINRGNNSSQTSTKQAEKTKTAGKTRTQAAPTSNVRLEADGIRIIPGGPAPNGDEDTSTWPPASGILPDQTERHQHAPNLNCASVKVIPERKIESGDHSIHAAKMSGANGGTSGVTPWSGEPDPVPYTPTKHQGLRKGSIKQDGPRSRHSTAAETIDLATWTSDDSCVSNHHKQGSEVASCLTVKSLANISGEIPFGNSAFSELDLPLTGTSRSRPKRPSTDQKHSLKGMPNVFKKVVWESKKMIQDMNETPKHPGGGKPPSIEKWLNGTVDPFVQNAPQETTNMGSSGRELPRGTDAARRSSRDAGTSQDSTRRTRSAEAEAAEISPAQDVQTNPESGTARDATTPSPAALKRRKATRSASSPIKPGQKRPFLGLLRDAFQGESAGPSGPRKSYQSYESRKGGDVFDTQDDGVPSDSLSGLTDHDVPLTQPEHGLLDQVDVTDNIAGPRFRPPTRGNHELSTILSEENSSAIESDMSSGRSHSTLTKSTNLTKDTGLSTKRSQKTGLKRRLTKHSDLVSVLSFPDDENVPGRIKSSRSRPSQRKVCPTSDDVIAEELLKEFADDEVLYQRELKTLVDGVIPVLLSHVLNGRATSELFGVHDADRNAGDLSKSVVSMGVALEKIRHAHKKAPCSDLRRLAHWAPGVVPKYNSYLDAWRLGFQDLVVNLAPVGDGLDDDSLIGALPMNSNGDIIDDTGERVDVAHLLKKPLFRIKRMTKFIHCLNSIMPSHDVGDLLRDFESLQDKARRRYREEAERMTDEEALNTDTTRARDLRTFQAVDGITLNPDLKVNAKDIFSLDLVHSNGQRLECQVELVHRGNQSRASMDGDVLVREAGDARRSCLLFSPIPTSSISARTGDGKLDMVVMVRGVYRGKSWHELLTLTADNEDQVLDWLDLLPLSPTPPREPEPSVVNASDDEDTSCKKGQDGPIGARYVASSSSQTPSAGSSRQPRTSRHSPLARSHPLRANLPRTPDYSSPAFMATTQSSRTEPAVPTHDGHTTPRSGQDYPPGRPRNQNQQGTDHQQYREDNAPLPPVHRTLGSSEPTEPDSSSLTTPPVDLKQSEQTKRRTSSPLKHEYLPSNHSSGSESSLVDASDLDSSDDEIDSVDIPETELGMSIKQETPVPAYEADRSFRSDVAVDEVPRPTDSVVAESECSLTPSNSASQAGLHGHKISDENAARYMASISRWSEKGIWKEISGTPCSVIVTAGLIEAWALKTSAETTKKSQDAERPLLALDLTPLVLIRQSTALDLEIRSSVQSTCKISQQHSGGNFRFRCYTGSECYNLYMSVHHARLNNQKFIELENEARFRGFGEQQRQNQNDGDTSSRRRSWFGRKNSYRSSARAPSGSQDGASTTPSSSPSASSFLKRLTMAGNMSFNIARSSLDRESRMGSGSPSLYTSGSSSGGTTPRPPSVTIGSGSYGSAGGDSENMRIRLHLLVSASKWEDWGNCRLQIRRPPPGWHQALRADHGLEKRITVTKLPKMQSEAAAVVLDAVLGSGCFSAMGNRGIICGVWEEMRDAAGVVGAAPATGPASGNVRKWCFQFASAPEANWVLRLVHQEVLRA